MKWLIICVCITFLGCRQQKEISKKVSTSTAKYISEEANYIEKKDSTFQYEPAPEKSQNKLISDSSFLDTSLAWSIAKWQDGVLIHTIANKPSIPIRVPAMIHIQTHTIRDTVVEYLELTDENTITVEKFRVLNAFFYYSGWIVWVSTLLLIIWKFGRHLRLPK